MAARVMARRKARGIHMNMQRVEIGVGLKAILPSWKMRGLGYSVLGRTRHFLLSASLTKYTSCNETNVI